MPGGKQRRESVSVYKDLDGYSIDDARTAMAKRTVQKKENRMMDIIPESKITFQELTDWYIKLKTVKKLASHKRIKIALNNFNEVFGRKKVNAIKLVDIENYQEGRIEQKRSPATVDMEVSIVKTMTTKAFYNDMIDGRVLKAFGCVKKKLKKGSNARKRTLSINEYLKLLEHAPSHLKAFLVIGFNTGMRRGEIRTLKWSYIDRKNGFIRLPANVTKEKREKNIPINHHVKSTLEALPRALRHDFVITYLGHSQ